MLLSVHQTIVPDVRKANPHKERRSNLDVGKLEGKVLEGVGGLCTFSSIYYQPEIRKQCDTLTEEYEEEIARKIVEWTKAGESFNLVHGICHEVTNACPATVNSTDSEVVKRKDKYLSERAPSQQVGPVVKIVAESWNSIVEDASKDVVSLQYENDDAVTRRIFAVLDAVATRAKVCETIVIGKIDMRKNDIPPPYGDYLEGLSLALWRAEDKLRPHLLKEVGREEELTQFDVLNFIFRSVSLPDSWKCMAELSNSVSKEDLRKIQEPDEL